MGNFLYAIPGSQPVNLARLQQVGLAKIWGCDEKTIFTQRAVSNGPGGSCQLVGLGDKAKAVVYRPAEQAWVKSHNELYHVGMFNDDQPTEAELRREKILEGHQLELGSKEKGNEKWTIPIARFIAGGSRMPHSLMLAKDGTVTSEALPQFADFSMKVDQIWEDFLIETKQKEGRAQMDLATRMLFAIEALSLNYRIGIEESNLLKLITTENLHLVLEAIIDVPTILEMSKDLAEQKKNTDGPKRKDG